MKIYPFEHLKFLSFLYIVIGLLGLLASLSSGEGAAGWVIFMYPLGFLMVIPIPIIELNAAGNEVLLVSAIVALILGIFGVVATRWLQLNKILGHFIWRSLIILGLVVNLWNIYDYFSRSSEYDFAVFSHYPYLISSIIVWLIYIWLYILALKSNKASIIVSGT